MSILIVCHPEGPVNADLERRAIALSPRGRNIVRGWDGTTPLPDNTLAFTQLQPPINTGDLPGVRVLVASELAAHFNEIESGLSDLAAEHDLRNVAGAADGHFDDLLGYGLSAFMQGVALGRALAAEGK